MNILELGCPVCHRLVRVAAAGVLLLDDRFLFRCPRTCGVVERFTDGRLRTLLLDAGAVIATP